jgi:hypothetical protein
MLDAVQGRDTLVRDTISKGGFVQGAQHPRIFGRGHINPASGQALEFREGISHIDITKNSSPCSAGNWGISAANRQFKICHFEARKRKSSFLTTILQPKLLQLHL